jgi:hypothetical protein
MFLGIIVSSLCLIPRIDLGFHSGQYLWAEDGNVFINQVHELGMYSLWTPYAGYLHIYPRLIMLFGSFFDLKSQVDISLWAWFLAYFFMIFTIISAAYRFRLSILSICALVAVISLQPNTGEVFFNITNAQWMLGAALSIYVFAFEDQRPTLLHCFVLSILCLTGPFSIMIFPIVLINNFFKKTIEQNIITIFIIFIGALIQILILLNSGRIATGLVSHDLMLWFHALFSMLLFRLHEKNLAIIVGIFFWILFVVALVFAYRDKSIEAINRYRVSILFLMAAIINIVAALYALKSDLNTVITSDEACRFNWIPCTLIFISAIIVSTDLKKLRFLMIICIGTICIFLIKPIDRLDLQFPSYANFSKYERVIIPINPQVSSYPGFSIDSSSIQEDSKLNISEKSIEYILIDKNGQTLDNLKPSAIIDPQDLILMSKERIECQNASDVGVDIEMNHKEGWIQFFWSESRKISTQSLSRFYPSGRIKAQFAFPNKKGGAYIQLAPLSLSGNVKIVAYCLP